MKLLFKQAMKSLFSNKIFASIMILIVFISGATYTLFESTSKSFEASYNKLTQNGNLHDAIIKQKYSVQGSYTLQADPATKTATSANIKYSAPMAILPSNNDYLDYLQTKFPNKIVTKITVKLPKDLDMAISNAISEQTALINKNVVGGKSNAFAKAMTDIYKNDLTTDNTQSLAISTLNSAFKAVTSNTIDPANDYLDGYKKSQSEQDQEKPYDGTNVHNVNKLVMYDGTNQFTHNQTYKQMQDELNYRAAIANIPVTPNMIVNRSKGFRWSIQDSLSKTITVTDPSSYEAVISPSYANLNNKISIQPNVFLNLYKQYQDKYPLVSSPDTFMTALTNGFDFPQSDTKNKAIYTELSSILKKKYASNIVSLDTTPYFIIGIGTTPDFAYPIVDQAHPTPDVNTQGVVFMNRRGYERVFDGFRTAPNENYISLKFLPKVSRKRQDAIMAQIEDIARTGSAALSKYGISYNGNIPIMSWPGNVHIVTRFNAKNDSILLAEERVAFLGKLKQTLETLSLMTTIMLIIFVGSIVILVFSSMIETKRKVIATLLSLGYTKAKIAFSFATTALIIGAVPSLLGYITGHFLQYAFINLFNNYWTIPVYGETFSWISLVIVVFLPFIAFFILIFGISFLQMRYNITSMLHDNISRFNFAPSILKYFNWFSVKFKYSISLTINNFGRLMLISVTGIISVAAIIIGLSTIGRATYAYNATSALSNYTYKVDLYSPTVEGGTYNDVDYSQLYKDLNGPNGKPIGITYKGIPTAADDAKLNKPHWHIPGQGDASLANINTITHDPAALPYIDHYLRYKFQSKPLLDIPIGGVKGLNAWNTAKKLMPDNQRNKADTNAISFMKNTTQKPPDKTKNNNLNPDYIKYFQNQIPYNKDKELYPYTISYQNVITNVGDEEYTYISTQIDKTKKRDTEKFHITGYNPNSKFLNIPKNETSKLQDHSNDYSKPILINKYISASLGLSVGDHINMNVLNDTNRFQGKGSSQTTRKQSFTVQGILNTYDDGGIYTLQSIANNVIGMNKIPPIKGGLPNDNFNGIFTKKQNPVLLNTLPLYSPSGVYLPTDVVTGAWNSVLQNVINTPSLWKNTSVTSSQAFVAKYSATPLVGSFDTINWKSINQYTFKNISTLSAYLITIIQLISIILSVMFAIIVSSLFVDSNKKKIATLWTLGYRRGEIIKMFLTTYILPIIITLAASIPISFAVVTIMKLVIMNFAFILIPFAILWWMPIVAVALISLIFSLSIIGAIFSMKGDVALNAFKEE